MDGDGDDVACWTEKNIDFTHFNWVKTLMIKEKKETCCSAASVGKVSSVPVTLNLILHVSCLDQTVEV